MDENTKQELIEVLMETNKPDPIVPVEASRIDEQYDLRQVLGAIISYVAAWIYIQACLSSKGV